MPLTLKKLKEKLDNISKKGFVKSLRGHDTGIGHTLEQFLGLSENNISLPDLGLFELKAQRMESQSLITLFTKKPDDELNVALLNKFGYPRVSNGLKVIHQTIVAGQINKKGFTFINKANRLLIFKDEKYIFSYDKNKLRKVFDRKVGRGMILVLAKSRKHSGRSEEFHYREAYLLREGNFEKFLENLSYDIRIGRYPNGRPHDHGSAFRIKKSALNKIFKIYKKLI